MMSSTNELTTVSNPLPNNKMSKEVSLLTEKVKTWGFTKVPGSCASDMRFKNLAQKAYDDQALVAFTLEGQTFPSSLRLYHDIIKQYPHRFTTNLPNRISHPDFIMTTGPTDSPHCVFLRSLVTSSSVFPFTPDQLRKICVIPTEKGNRISIHILLRLNFILQYAVLTNMDQLYPVTKKPQQHQLNNSFMRGFNGARSLPSSAVLKEEICMVKVKRLVTAPQLAFIRKYYNTNVIGSRINNFSEELRAAALQEKVYFPLESAVALLAYFQPGTVNMDIEATMAAPGFPHSTNTVYSTPKDRLPIPETVEEIANWHITRHLEHNDHHPQYHERLHTVFGVKQTIEVMCDLLSCALQQGAANVKEGLYIIIKWLLDKDFKIQYKYRSLNVWGILISFMRFEVVFSNSTAFNSVHRTRDWRAKKYLTSSDVLKMYNGPFDPHWRKGMMQAYFLETSVHSHMVNTLLRSFSIRAKHDADKFEYYAMIAYMAKWGSLIPDETPPELTNDWLGITTAIDRSTAVISRQLDAITTEVTGTAKQTAKTMATIEKFLNEQFGDVGEGLEIISENVGVIVEGQNSQIQTENLNANNIKELVKQLNHLVKLTQTNSVKLQESVTGAVQEITTQSQELTTVVTDTMRRTETTQHSLQVAAGALGESSAQISADISHTTHKTNALIDLVFEKMNNLNTEDITAQVGGALSQGAMTAFAGFLAPMKDLIKGFAGKIREMFDQMYDLLSKVCLPARSRSLLENFSDFEIMDVCVSMITFFSTSNPLFKLLLVLHMCQTLEIADVAVRAYRKAKASLVKLFTRAPTTEGSTETADGPEEEVPDNFFSLIIRLLTNPDTVSITAIIATLGISYFGISAATTNTRGFANTIVQSFRNIGFMSMGVMAIPKLMEVFSRCIHYLMSLYKEVKTGEKQPSVLDLNSRAAKVIQEANVLLLDDVVTQVYTNKPTRRWATEVVAELDNLISIYGSEVCYAPQFFSQLLTAQKNLTQMRNYLRDVTALIRRVTPFAVQYVGPAQIGKSQVMNTVSEAFEKKFYPQAAVGSMIYTRNVADAFYSGYNGHKIVRTDDQYMIFSDQEMAEIIATKSSVEFKLNMADLREKGRSYVAEFQVTTTNTPYPEAQTVRHIKAVHERRDILWQCALADVCQGAEGVEKMSRVSREEYERLGLNWADCHKFPHLKFTALNPVAQTTTRRAIKTGDVYTGWEEVKNREWVDFETMLQITIDLGCAYNCKEHALVARAAEGVPYDVETATQVEAMFVEYINAHPHARPTGWSPGMPTFTREAFRKAFVEIYTSQRIGEDDLPPIVNIKALLDAKLESELDFSDNTEPTMDDATKNKILFHVGTAMVALARYGPTMVALKRYLSVHNWIGLTNVLGTAFAIGFNAKFHPGISNGRDLVRAMKDIMVLNEITEETTLDEAMLIVLQEYRTINDVVEFFNSIKMPLSKHFYPANDDLELDSISLIPFCNRVDINLALILNSMWINKQDSTPDQKALHHAVMMYFYEHQDVYDVAYQHSSSTMKLPSTFLHDFRAYLIEQVSVDMPIEQQREVAGAVHTWPCLKDTPDGPDKLNIRIVNYDFPIGEVEEPTGKFAVELGTILGAEHPKHAAKIDLELLLPLRMNYIDGVQSISVDVKTIANTIDPGWDYAAAVNEIDPNNVGRQVRTILGRMPSQRRKVLKHCIALLDSLTLEDIKKIFKYKNTFLRKNIITIQHIQLLQQEYGRNVNTQNIPTNANRFELFLANKMVLGCLMGCLSYTAYRAVKSIIQLIFPPTEETSKLGLRTGKAQYLTPSLQLTTSCEPTSAEDNHYLVAKRMIKGSVRLRIVTGGRDMGFNGFAIGRDIITVAHPFLHDDQHLSSTIDLEVMTGDSLETMQCFKVDVKKHMVFDDKNDRVLIRIPNMRFFKDLSVSAFHTTEEYSQGVFHNQTMWGYAFMRDTCLPLAISGTRYVNKPKVVSEVTGCQLPSYLIFAGGMEKGTSGTLFYTTNKDNTIRIMGIQSCRHGINSFLTPLNREWFLASRNRLNQFENHFVHEGPLVCCDDQPRSRLNLNPNIPFEGCVPHGMTLSNMTATQFRPTIISDHYDTGEIPAILNPRDPRIPNGAHPLQHSINKWSAHEMIEPDPELLEIAITDVTTFYKNLLKNPKFTTNHSLEKIIQGHNSPLALNTSPGLPFVLDRFKGKAPGKRAYININEQGEVDFIADELRERVGVCKEKLRRGIIPANSNYVFAKDELRPAAKVIGPPVKTRSISVMEMSLSLIFRQHCMDYETALNNLADGSQPYCVGVSIESPTGNSMYQHMKNVGDVGFDFDVPHWDGHFPAWLFRAVAEHIRRMYGWAKDSDEFRIFEGVMLNALFGYEQIEDLVYQKPGGMPSGFAGTASVNTLAHIILFYLLYLRICMKTRRPQYANWYCFRQFICYFVYGDDITVTIADEVLSWLNANTFAEEYATLGWPVTTADKTGEREPFKPISELQFLKRCWIRSDDIPGYYQAALSQNTIDRLCEWYRTGQDDEKQQVENFFSHLEFSWYWGRTIYDRNLLRLNDALESVDAPALMINYHQMGAIIKSRTWEEFSSRKKNELLFGVVEETSDDMPMLPLFARITSDDETDEESEPVSQVIPGDVENQETRYLIPDEQPIIHRGHALRGLSRAMNTFARPLHDIFMIIATVAMALAILFRLRRGEN